MCPKVFVVSLLEIMHTAVCVLPRQPACISNICIRTGSKEGTNWITNVKDFYSFFFFFGLWFSEWNFSKPTKPCEAKLKSFCPHPKTSISVIRKNQSINHKPRHDISTTAEFQLSFWLIWDPSASLFRLLHKDSDNQLNEYGVSSSVPSLPAVNKHKPWIETSYHGVITENMDTVLLDPPLVALDKDAPVPYAGRKSPVHVEVQSHT